MKVRSLFVCQIICWIACAATAYNGHIASEGPVKIIIGEINTVEEFDKPADITVFVANSAQKAIKVRLTMNGLVDEWYAIGSTDKTIVIAPKSQQKETFQVASASGALSALYPVHINAEFSYAGERYKTHCVQIFDTDFTKATTSNAVVKMPTNIVPSQGSLSLMSLKTQRVAWQYFDKPLLRMPVGWSGSDERSGVSFAKGNFHRGSGKNAISMHPTWRGGAGTVFAEYRLKLPRTEKIEFRFFNAIRDHSIEEPPSDGVTFRVLVGEEKLFERHTDSKVWVEGKVDLSRFAGKEILLRLESHPGPKRDTTCDASYWAQPMIITGEQPKPLSKDDRIALHRHAQNIIKSQQQSTAKDFVFRLSDGNTAAIVLGKDGLIDSAIAFGKGDDSVVFDGINLVVLDHKIGSQPGNIRITKTETSKDIFGKVTIKHRLLMNDEEFDLVTKIFKENCGLRIKFDSPQRITDISLASANQKAKRVYYGHGYCIEEPKVFRAGFGGHNLSTSHVGFDFEKGVSLLMATDNPPDYLQVTPDENNYSLHTHHNATLTFVPGAKGAFDCAVKYQKLYDKKPSPGFQNKAGRFVFDIWGGRYSQIADTMAKMIDYGLTNSLLTIHVWQRWGYDYRLPDIYPPDPAYGTIDDMKKIATVCNNSNIPWGLHDNYIDFYPDAANYSYDDICFTQSGDPVKAWINKGRDAQSYRWRPDRIMPFVKRNLKPIKENLAPNHYFIDVFTSIPCFDYYDKSGQFHSMLETRKCWGETFRWIQDYLGGAITTSEAGHDQLTGYLDGADCQHLTLSPKGGRYFIQLTGSDWQRVPWFDAVLHDRFSLHGVGYPSRYRLTEYDDHESPLQSDDYINAEILQGHAMMIDNQGFGRGAVRKYWLAQDFIKTIATDTIKSVDFVDNDIHRQIITWNCGAKIYSNRSKNDWQVKGKILPQYGYFAKNGPVESSIEKIDGVIIEQSQTNSKHYFNARGFDIDNCIKMIPRIENLEHFTNRKFKMTVNWDVASPAKKNLDIFVHFCPVDSGSDEIAFQGDLRPYPPMSNWKNQIKTGNELPQYIPEKCLPGDYDIMIGVWDPSTGTRYRLMGEDTGSFRYKLGTLTIEGSKDNVTALKLTRHNPAALPKSRRNLNKTPINFGPATTWAAFRCQIQKDAIIIIPLPDIEQFPITLNLEKLLTDNNPIVKSIEAIDAAGKKIRDVAFKQNNSIVKFQTKENEFAYQIKKTGLP